MITKDSFEKLKSYRQRSGVYPTEEDHKFFSSSRALRNYHVRQSVQTDDYGFIRGEKNPVDFVTIVFRATYAYVVVPADHETFGPVVNCDSYASFRLESLERERV